MRQIRTGAAALAALAALAACGNDKQDKTDRDLPGEATTTSTPPPNYKLVPDESGPIEPGRWAIRADGSPETPLAVIDVPAAGFNGGESWIWTNEPWAVIGVWTVSGVYKDPCTRSGPAASAGNSVEDLAAALDAQKLTTATDPVPVTIDGHEGLYLEVSTPAKLDYGTCHEDGLVIWNDAPAWSEPAVTRFWILDVDAQRVVLTLNGVPTKATERVFTGMVRSAEFVEG
jgi:hypothetical protein